MSKNATPLTLDELLKPLGFARHGVTWNRKVGSLVDVVDVQISKSGDMFTLNVGVLDTNVYIIFWGKEAPAFIEEPSCIVRVRIGELIDAKDHWWPIGEEGIDREVAEIVTSHVIPFFDRMRTREALERWLTNTKVEEKNYPLPVVCLAILRNELGKANEACAMLAKLKKKTVGAWRQRIADVAYRLGCG
jgi:hypothetical protein